MQARISHNLCRLFADFGVTQVCETASRCGVLPFVYPTTPEAAYRQEYELSFAQDAAQLAALEELTRAFVAAGIEVVPLKGCILKPLYPGGSHMRTMCDLDILFHPEDSPRVKEVMLSLGYTITAYDMYHHDEYARPPLLSVEMHRALIPETEHARRYYTAHDPWMRVIRREDGTCTFTDEDHYIFILSHFAAHLLERGGSSLRGLLDLYVFRTAHENLDLAYISRAVTEMELAAFEEKYLRMAYDLFDREEPQYEAWRREVEIMLSCGMLGTTSIRAARRREEIGGSRLHYIWKRLFPSYPHMCNIYPRVTRRKWLLPYYYLKRILTEPFRNRAALRAEFNELSKKKTKDD